MQKIDGTSLDLVGENKKKLAEVLGKAFPEVVAEGEVDLDKLALLLGKDKSDPDKLERYNFTWAGKRQAAKLALTPSSGTLRPAERESVNWDSTKNLYIEGDNLEVLKLLQKSYFGKVKMIYIDPPYNTGKEFVYPDDYADSIQNYLELTEQINENGRRITTNTETSGRYHTNWLNMMYPRLKLARNLLRDDGVIFISIDDNEVSNLRKICDEIFGEENFVAQCVRRRRDSQANLSKNISPIHEYVILYSKSTDTILNKVQIKIDTSGYKNPDNDPRGLYTTMPCTNKGGSVYDILSPSGKLIRDEWRFKRETFEELKNDNRIIFPRNGEGKPRYKLFLSEKQEIGMLANTWWDFLSSNQEATKEIKEYFEKLIFDTPKPSGLLEYCISLASDRDDIILDFFSGSATTAHAVLDLNRQDGGNRQFIMVQLPEPCEDGSEARKAGYKNICEIGKERIRRVIKKIAAEEAEKAKSKQSELKLGADGSGSAERKEPLDLGFKVFKLDTSNFISWDSNPDHFDESSLQAHLSNIKMDRSQQDLLYELFIKLGVTLNTPFEKVSLAGKNMYDIGCGTIYACLDEDLDIGFCNAMIAYHDDQFPKETDVEDKKEERELERYRLETTTFIFRDSSFANDNVKTNILQTLRQSGLENIKAI
jgi:DNA methylase N-4/N-6